MKKLFALLLLLPALFLVSCSDDDKDGSGQGLNIVGKWDFIDCAVKAETSEEAASKLLQSIYTREIISGFSATRFEFTTNGEFIFYRFKQNNGFVKESNGTYKIKDTNKLELTYTSPVDRKYEYTVSMEKDALVILANETSGSTVLASQEYPGWQKVEVKEVLESLYFRKAEYI